MNLLFLRKEKRGSPQGKIIVGGGKKKKTYLWAVQQACPCEDVGGDKMIRNA